MVGTSIGDRHRFSDKWGKHELDVLAVLSSAFPQWLTSRQIAQRVKAYADSYGELADQAAKAAFAKQFQRDRAKLAAMGIAIESRQPEYSSKSNGQDFASYRLQLGDETRIHIPFNADELPILAIANYLAQSVAFSHEQDPLLAEEDVVPSESLYEITPSTALEKLPLSVQIRMQRVPAMSLGLNSIVPGLGIKSLNQPLREIIDARKFEAQVIVDGKHMNVAYSNANDLVMFMLAHPDAVLLSPQHAIDSYRVRLEAALKIGLGSIDSHPPVEVENEEDDDQEALSSQKHRGRGSRGSRAGGSEVDRRLRLLLFLSAHLDEQYPLEELAHRFIGAPRTNSERNKFIAIIRKDLETLTTVSDDGELAGSQFFDIDWDLLDQNIAVATNSLGLERLAGISPEYLKLLLSATHYLAHSALLEEEQRGKAQILSEKLNRYTSDEAFPTIRLTGYEIEPPTLEILESAVDKGQKLAIKSIDPSGDINTIEVTPLKVFSNNGIYQVLLWNKKEFKQGLIIELSRITSIEILETSDTKISHDLKTENLSWDDINSLSSSNLDEVSFCTDMRDLPYIKNIPGAYVESCKSGEKIYIARPNEAWMVRFIIAHSRHIISVAPQSIREKVIKRAQRELKNLDTSTGNVDID